MKFWLAFPLFALAQASCYDYEYYDPDTQASIPGNACAKQAAAAAGGVAQPIGQPIGVATTQFGTASTQFGAQYPATQIGQTTVYGSMASLPTYSTTASTQFAAPLPTYSSAPLAQSTTVTYGSTMPQTTVYASSATRLPVATSFVAPPVAVAAPVAVTTAVRTAPVATATSRSSASTSSAIAELQYYKELGERQARRHKQNARIVREANEDLGKASLFNRIIAGAGNTAPWYPVVRLQNQKEVAEAYRSEKQIANKNAEDAYARFQKDPSRLNLLVSKYQDLNADLRGAAHQYNVVNAGTFGQNLASGGLFGSGLGSSLTITRLITQRQQSEDLEDIQRQMKRLGRQITVEAQAKLAAVRASASQGSVQQRMMGMSQYGPQTRSA